MMDTLSPITALNTEVHDRNQFTCGAVALDRYLREQVSQDIHRRVAACFVALTDRTRIIGYYTLATASVPLTDLPEQLRRKLPRYSAIPAIRMGRLWLSIAISRGKVWGVYCWSMPYVVQPAPRFPRLH